MFELTPWNQSNVFTPLREIESFFNSAGFSGFRTEISDHKEYYLLEAHLPGMRKEDISVRINQNYMTIQARRQVERTQTNQQEQYLYQERHSRSYSRSFDISAIQSDRIKASFENGRLSIILPKKKPAPDTPEWLEIQS